MFQARYSLGLGLHANTADHAGYAAYYACYAALASRCLATLQSQY